MGSASQLVPENVIPVRSSNRDLNHNIANANCGLMDLVRPYGSCGRWISADHGVTNKQKAAVSAEPLRQHTAAPTPISAPAAGIHAPFTFVNPLVESASRSRHDALRAEQGKPDKVHISRLWSERRGQLVTAAIGVALTLAMGLVVLFGYRLVTHIRASIIALQAASALQSYPEEISAQLAALCDRLEARADSGQALADLQNMVRRFDRNFGELSDSGDDSPQVAQAVLLWHQYGQVIDPVISFRGQPYADSVTAETTFSPKGREHYAAAERAHQFAAGEAKALQAQLMDLAATIRDTSSDAALRLRTLLFAGVVATLVLAAAAAWFQHMRSRLLRTQAELQAAHEALVRASRQAGMAEVASSVLHNVGNVLNSVNVSATLLDERIQTSKASGLARVAAMLQEQGDQLGSFIASDDRGKRLPTYLAQLSSQLLADREATLKELASLIKSVEHIKDIVRMQQSYATHGGVEESVAAADLVADSVRLNAEAFSRHGVTLACEFEEVPAITVDKHRVLQILVNLIRNAKYACEDSGRSDKRITIRVTRCALGVAIAVVDNGVGIPAENMTRIFSHGFTTRVGGHGFGLHSAALAAQELKGSLGVASDGPGCGATFSLELPITPAKYSL
jgi:signal transduction histidine kinase